TPRQSQSVPLPESPAAPVVIAIPSPELEIISPSPNFMSRRDVILVKGQVKYVQTLWVNGNLLTVDAAGKFYSVVRLTEPHTYTILNFVALGTDGTTLNDSRKVFFEPVTPTVAAPAIVPAEPTPDSTVGVTRTFTPAQAAEPAPVPAALAPAPPSVVLTFPVAGYKTQSTSVLVQGQVTDVTQIWVNGVQVPTHTTTTFQNYVPFPANQDQLDIFVVVKNATGATATASRTVLREIPSNLLPSVSIISPVNGATINALKVVVQGLVINTQKLLINDRPVGVAKDGTFAYEQPLPASGNFKITATAIGTKGLTDSQSITVNRAAPLAPAPSASQISANELDIRLSQKISMDLINASLTDVLKVLAQKAGINLVADATVQGTVTLQLTDMAVRDAIDVILNSQGLTYRYVGNAILVAQQRNLDTPTNLTTDIIKLNNIQAATAQTIVTKYLTQPESVEVLAQENLIIVRAGAQKAAQIHTILTRLDAQKIPQIVLEARIVETAANALQNLGFNWPTSIGWGTDYQQTVTNGVPSTVITNSTSIVAILNLLQEKGKAKVLAQPRLKALQQTEATIFIGDQVPYTEVSIDPTGRLTEIVKYLNLGISLKVNPDINADQGTIRLKINPEISYIFGFRGKNNDVPWVKTRQVETSVEVKDGETIVIGGLFNSSDLSTESKLPFIGDLPLLGNLLSGSRADQNNTELIITITPRIVNVDSLELPN
ncbi:MAG: secretin and TonB N-terminal domain-containing protein, partial [Candidatus Margulisiibacteriota bacterium]